MDIDTFKRSWNVFFTIIVSSILLAVGNIDLNTELKMAERDCKQAQSELATVLRLMQGWEGKANENEQKLQKAEEEIKELKEKLKGNISLIKAKDLIWNEIISEMKARLHKCNCQREEHCCRSRKRVVIG